MQHLDVHPFCRWLSAAILHRRWLILAALLATTVFFALQIPRIAINISPEEMQVVGHPDTLFYARYIETFGTDEIVLVELYCHDVFTHKVMATIYRLTESMQRLQNVRRVLSLYTATDIRGSSQGVEITPFMSQIPETAHELENVRKQVHENPLCNGSLVSHDDRSTLLLVELDRSGDNFHEKRKRLVREIQALVCREQTDDIELYVAGHTVLSTVLPEMLMEEQRIFVPIILLGIVLALYAALRSVWGIFLPLMTVLLSLTWLLGFLVLCGKGVEVITNVLPPLMLVMAIADSVHILAHYQEELERDRRERDALLDATAYTLTPCFVTSLTTAAAFGSLMVSQVQGIRDLGLLASFGVLAAFVISITFLPIMLSFLNPARLTRHKGQQTPTLDRALARLARFNHAHKVHVLVTSFLLIIVSLAGVFQLKVETSLLTYIKADNPLVTAVSHIEEHLTGTSTLDLVFDFQGPDQVKDPENLAKLLDLEQYLAGQPVVTHCFSLVDLLQRMSQVFRGGDPLLFVLPESAEEVAQYLLLYSMSGDEEDLSRYVDDDYERAVLRTRLKSVNSDEMDRFITQVKTHIRKRFPDLRIQVTGGAVLTVDSIDAIVRGQIQGLGIALAIICVILSLLFLSFRLGLLSMIPNLIPVLMTLGLMGWAGIPIDTGTAVISCVAIGIAVNDTIHFIVRFRKEYQNVSNEDLAAHRSLTLTGRAIFFTSSILVTGFFALVLSQFKPIIYFGFLMGVTMITALAGDLVLLPVLLIILKPIRNDAPPGFPQGSSQNDSDKCTQ